MAKFCTQCGKKLEEGEECNCPEAKALRQQQEQRPTQQAPQFDEWGARIYEGAQKVRSGVDSVRSGVDSVRDKMGVKISDDCFERRIPIVPKLVEPCEEEVPVKQYHLADFRSRLKGLRAEGRIQVTNKRVIFRASGRSLLGRAVVQDEIALDEVVGIQISKGVRFSFVDFFLWLLLLGPLVNGVVSLLTRGFGLISFFIGIVFLVPFFVVRKRLLLKTICCACAMGCFHGQGGAILFGQIRRLFYTDSGGRAVPFIMLAAASMLYLVSLIFYALKTSVSIAILGKGGGTGGVRGSPIYVLSEQHFRIECAREIFPAEDTDLAIQELGALITDIQKMGDFAIDKWAGKTSAARQ